MNMKRKSKDVCVLRRIKDYINSLTKKKPSYRTREQFGIFVFLATSVLSMVGCVHVLLMIFGKADPAHFGLWYLSAILVGFSGPMYFCIGVSGHSASPRERIIGKMIAFFIVHAAYYLCMIASLLQFAPNLVPANGVLTMPYVCLWLLTLVEVTALLLYIHDIFSHLERTQPSRWWIRTTPYPVIGVIFLLFVNLWNDDHGRGADYSLIFSVAVSVLAVNYLIQIINERIVPKEGPYKKTYMAVYNRSIHTRPAYHRPLPRRAHARRPKPSSPSAGRGRVHADRLCEGEHA